ncbi:Two-component sensor histidine kinase, contains HisKA and HATPase domains [Spirosomataceae bacterium TFI 002]|nr:Two-component sensor histidine kinase, contains HisKA and HATPase domains [Spirosomataceae bacterium TFI 002]
MMNQFKAARKVLMLSLLLSLFSFVLKAQQKTEFNYQIPNLDSLPLDTALVKIGDAINQMKGEADAKIKEDLWHTLKRAKASKRPLLIAKTYKELANWHYLSVTSENKDSIYYYDDQALQFFLQTDEKELISNAYKTVGFDLQFMQRFAEAEVQYFKGLEVAKSIEYQSGINSTHASLASLYTSTKDYKSALRYSEMVVASYEEEGNTHPLIRALVTLSNIYVQLEQPEKALNATNKALALVADLPEKYQASESYNVRAWRGKALRKLKRYDEALKDFEFSWKGMQEIYGAAKVNGWKGDIGSVYFLQNKYEKAIPFLKDYIEHFKGKKVYNPEELKDHYLWLAESYKTIGKPDLAYKYLSEGKDIAINALEQETVALRGELRVKYETEQKDETISTQSDLIQQQREIQWLTYAIVGLLTLILGGLFYTYRNNVNKNNQLRELNNSLEVTNVQLDKRNAENELLLKEIHHRVKNNLEIVSGLLELQSSQIDDPSVQAAMLSSQNRVHSMGIIHQKLYQSEHLTSIEMRDYFVNLGENIMNSFSSDGKVKIECDMPELVLDVDTAISVGLIANELLTNAFKYAFEGKEKGKIEITMKSNGPNDDNLELNITDDGIGKNEDSPAKGTGFGTMLIDLLTKQLNGTISYKNENGTKVSLVFNKTNHLA